MGGATAGRRRQLFVYLHCRERGLSLLATPTTTLAAVAPDLVHLALRRLSLAALPDVPVVQGRWGGHDGSLVMPTPLLTVLRLMGADGRGERFLRRDGDQHDGCSWKPARYAELLV